MDSLAFNRGVIDEFRANDGVWSGPVEGGPMVLITMTGAKSGRDAQAALMDYLTEYETSAAAAGRVIPVFRLVRD